MKLQYSGQQVLSIEGIILTPGLNEVSEQHMSKLSENKKFLAMQKEGIFSSVSKETKKAATPKEESAPVAEKAVETDVKVKKSK